MTPCNYQAWTFYEGPAYACLPDNACKPNKIHTGGATTNTQRRKLARRDRGRGETSRSLMTIKGIARGTLLGTTPTSLMGGSCSIVPTLTLHLAFTESRNVTHSGKLFAFVFCSITHRFTTPMLSLPFPFASPFPIVTRHNDPARN